MSIVVRVYCEEKIYNINMSGYDTATIGSGPSDTLRLVDSNMKKKHITITKKRDDYVIKGKDLYNRYNDSVSSEVVAVGNTYIVNVTPQMNISIHPIQEGSANIDLTYQDEVFIGRETDNNIVFSNGRTSSKHCKIYRESGLLKLRDLRSSNGTYVNGKRITEKILADGDVINFAIYEAVINRNILTIYNIGKDMHLNLKKVEIPVNKEAEMDFADSGFASFDHNSTMAMLNGADYGEGTMSMFDSTPASAVPVAPVYNSIPPHHEGTMSMFDSMPAPAEPAAPVYNSAPPRHEGTMSMFDSMPVPAEPAAPAYGNAPSQPETAMYGYGSNPSYPTPGSAIPPTNAGTMSMFEEYNSSPAENNIDAKMQQRLEYVNKRDTYNNPPAYDNSSRTMTDDGFGKEANPPHPASYTPAAAPMDRVLKYVDVPDEKTTALHDASSMMPSTGYVPQPAPESAPVIESGSSYSPVERVIPAWELHNHPVQSQPAYNPNPNGYAPGENGMINASQPNFVPGGVPYSGEPNYAYRPAQGNYNDGNAGAPQAGPTVDYADYACGQYQSAAREMPEKVRVLSDGYYTKGDTK